jgi:nicotinamide-nucleotide adenylyltransferase
MNAEQQWRIPALEELLPVHRLLERLDPEAEPLAAAVCGIALQEARRVVALAGSFNPPHLAHVALLLAAQQKTQADASLFVLSVRTVDKEQVSGILLEDRLWLLCRLTADLPGGAVMVTNRGLYVEQAAALRHLCPKLEDLVFVTGYDKIVQIFDPRYYRDRDSALDTLFASARFLVAPREGHGQADLESLLSRPENAHYATRVDSLAIDGSLAHVSSTQLRASTGGAEVAPEAVPPVVAAFIRQSRCYAPDGGYQARAAALLQAAQGPQ